MSWFGIYGVRMCEACGKGFLRDIDGAPRVVCPWCGSPLEPCVDAGKAGAGASRGDAVPFGVLPPKRGVAGLTLEELDACVADLRREVDAMEDGGDQVRRVGLLRDLLAAVREVAVRRGLLRRGHDGGDGPR